MPTSGYHSHNTNRVTLKMEGKINLDGELLQVAQAATISASEPLAFLRL
jgi:hypothetical protein